MVKRLLDADITSERRTELARDLIRASRLGQEFLLLVFLAV